MRALRLRPSDAGALQTFILAVADAAAEDRK
jgi:hypothetical protein